MSRGAPVDWQIWSVAVALPIAILSLLCFAAQLAGPLNHDVSWLLDAGSRWRHGQRLYVDIVEINPPLVFYDYALLSAGTFSRVAFTAGMVAAIAASSLWAARLNGDRWGVATFLVCAASGALDFGQREQIAAIVTIPYLWANRARTGERVLLGAWSFIGFALKPQLLLIPAGATLGRMLQERSWRPAASPENVVLAALSATYAAAVAYHYPDYFRTIVPLGRLVYFALGRPFPGEPSTAIVFALCIALLVVALLRRQIWPETGALAGALACFVLQGRFWTYHLIPAEALALLVILLLVERPRGWPGMRAIPLVAMAALVAMPAFRPAYTDPIPRGAKAVLFLSADISAAYPAVFDRKVVNASPYPSLWTIPGAWTLLNDPAASPDRRRQASVVLADTRRRVVDDVLIDCPDPIFVDESPMAGKAFDLYGFLAADPRFPRYRAGPRIGNFATYRPVEPCPGS